VIYYYKYYGHYYPGYNHRKNNELSNSYDDLRISYRLSISAPLSLLLLFLPRHHHDSLVGEYYLTAMVQCDVVIGSARR
jgi:hypothetical protein